MRASLNEDERGVTHLCIVALWHQHGLRGLERRLDFKSQHFIEGEMKYVLGAAEQDISPVILNSINAES